MFQRLGGKTIDFICCLKMQTRNLDSRRRETPTQAWRRREPSEIINWLVLWTGGGNQVSNGRNGEAAQTAIIQVWGNSHTKREVVSLQERQKLHLISGKFHAPRRRAPRGGSPHPNFPGKEPPWSRILQKWDQTC